MTDLKIILYLFLTVPLLVSCGSKQESESSSEASAEEINEVTTKDDNDMGGQLVVSIGDQTFTIENFRKEVTNISVMDAASNGTDVINAVIKINDQQSVLFNMPTGKKDVGMSISGLTGEPGQISFFSFLERNNRDDHIMLKKGEATIKSLNLETGEFEATFKGEGGQLTDPDDSNNVKMEGSIRFTFPKINDYRTK